MNDIEALVMTNASLFALVGSRVTGFIVISPFPGQNVASTQRISLVLAVTFLATTFAPSTSAPRQLDLTLAGLAAIEVVCGLLVGAAFRFVFAAAEVLGSVLGQLTGLASPSVLNPTIDASDTVLGRIVSLGAMLVALSVGVHRVALGAVLESFRALPVGTAMAIDAPLLHFVELGIDSFVVGVRLATPVVGVTMLVQLILAMISRAAPSLQIFSVGFAVLFVTGLVTILTTLDDMAAGLAAHFGSLAAVIDVALTALRR